MKTILVGLITLAAAVSTVLTACARSSVAPSAASPSSSPSSPSGPLTPAANTMSGAASAVPSMVAPAQPASAAPRSATFDQQFIDMMVPHHQGAVEMAQIAQQRAEHAEIKALAGSIVTSQNAEIQDMKNWRKAWFGSDVTPAMDQPIPYNMRMPGMSSMMNMANDVRALRTASPVDRAFIDAMIPHHRGAIEMAQAAGSQAQHQEIKDLASSIIAAQQKEIGQMQDWRKSWYPAATASSSGSMPGMSDMPGMDHD